MTPSRYKILYASLSAIAQKVYDAVPIGEPWPMAQIYSEFRRSGGSADRNVIAGCLNTLKESHLINEKTTGQFQRAPVREKPAPAAASPEPPAAPPKPRMQAITGRLADLATTLRTLADDVELVALEMDEAATANEADLQKLKQLQQLLKSLS